MHAGCPDTVTSEPTTCLGSGSLKAQISLVPLEPALQEGADAQLVHDVLMDLLAHLL